VFLPYLAISVYYFAFLVLTSERYDYVEWIQEDVVVCLKRLPLYVREAVVVYCENVMNSEIRLLMLLRKQVSIHFLQLWAPLTNN
jgi:hypothetical protein